jgi:hypothetical protein
MCTTKLLEDWDIDWIELWYKGRMPAMENVCNYFYNWFNVPNEPKNAWWKGIMIETNWRKK